MLSFCSPSMHPGRIGPLQGRLRNQSIASAASGNRPASSMAAAFAGPFGLAV